jgi:release factor glutamine methyltransferase
MSKDEQWLLREKFGGEKSAAFFAACERLTAGEPLAYLIGHVPFLGCTIHLDSHPLIPRSETEFWAERFIMELQKRQEDVTARQPHILDLCAGSGCIGVAVAKQVPVARVDFAEVDARHLPTITKNLEVNDIDPTRTTIIKSDLFSNITNRYTHILTNPPYIDPSLDRAEPSVKTYEPHNALYGGQSGLVYISAILAGAASHLSPSGQLWLEHEPEQTTAIHAMAEINNFTISTHQDQYGTERYSILVLQ